MLVQITEPSSLSSPKPLAGPALGIDLGTTHSLVGLSVKGQVTLFPNRSLPRSSAEGQNLSTMSSEQEGSPLFPSIVFCGGFPFRSFKRLMGKTVMEAKSLGYTTFPYDETKTEGMVHLHSEEGSLSPAELSTRLLKHLKASAEAALGFSVSQAVITVPAYFDEAARKATRDAATAAGLRVLRLLNEPTAAALAYGLDHKATGLYAVYDLGGGTFDISILKLTKGVFQVLGTGGNPHLGGDDFDKIIAHYLKKTSSVSQKDLLEARSLKEALARGEVCSPLLSLSVLEELLRPSLLSTFDIMEKTLDSVSLTPKDLSGILLVGGSTRLPFLSSLLKKRFGLAPLITFHPEEAVARGAALHAEALSTEANLLLLDIVPLSLGLEIMGDLVEKIIPRNTPLPIAKTQTFTTHLGGQTAMDLHIVQGEREHASACRSLARLTLRGIPPLPAGEPRIHVTFSVDTDGLLTVSAEERLSGTLQKVEVHPTFGLSAEKVIDSLRNSFERASSTQKSL